MLEKLLCPSRSIWRRAWQNRVSRHNTRPARPRPIPRPIFLVLDRSCPKTDGLRPHRCCYSNFLLTTLWGMQHGSFELTLNQTSREPRPGMRPRVPRTFHVIFCRHKMWSYATGPVPWQTVGAVYCICYNAVQQICC